MPRIIFKCRYLKDASEHLGNFVQYVATRAGVEKMPDSTRLLPATKKQRRLIAGILQRFPDTADLFEYGDYLKEQTRENASEFISMAVEQNLDLIGKRKNYIGYIAKRPRVETLGTHGLFTDAGVPVVLSQVAEEVARHTGNVWTNVISLRREDAARLGYDSAKAWQDLIRGQRNYIAEQMKITPANLRWYAAYHDEGHHPHVHLIAYSVNPKEAYLTKQGIENMRSSLARDIFRQDLIQIYSGQTERRAALAKQSRYAMKEIIRQIGSCVCENKTIEELIAQLAERLRHTSGKKQYGYLKAPLKALIDQIVDELANDARVAECYAKWYELRNEVLRTYADRLPPPLPLSRQKEFKSIKNMVIAEALHIGSRHFTFEPDEEAQASMEEMADSVDETGNVLSIIVALPEANNDMRRVYAYLIKQRFIARDVITHFAKAKTLYESCERSKDKIKEYHNAVFVGLDENGVPRHAHKRGLYTTGGSYRGNVEGSDPRYSFHHIGAGDTLYVFEAPIDMLSFITFYPKDWKRNSYVTLDGVAEHAMLHQLALNPRLQKVVLCLDHDKAGIEAAGRLTEILREHGYMKVSVLQPEYKDWNECLKARNGVAPIPGPGTSQA